MRENMPIGVIFSRRVVEDADPYESKLLKEHHLQ